MSGGVVSISTSLTVLSQFLASEAVADRRYNQRTSPIFQTSQQAESRRLRAAGPGKGASAHGPAGTVLFGEDVLAVSLPPPVC